ncbi:MAG TPA: FHA domain-containing protein [Gemmatimonadales bacterium]
MPLLRLRDLRDQNTHEFEVAEIRLGRDPSFEFVVSGDGSEVVSGAHARLAHREGAWWIDDLGGRNGTFVDNTRVAEGQPVALAVGKVIALGTRGVRFEVLAVAEHRIADTIIDQPAANPLAETVPMDAVRDDRPPAAPRPTPRAPMELAFMDMRTARTMVAAGGRVRIGRGKECELRPVESGDTSVSRVHCEIVLKPDGAVVVRDARSRNGTLLNDVPVSGEAVVKAGDRIKLGDAGPDLQITEIRRAAAPASAASAAEPVAPPVATETPAAASPAAVETPQASEPRRSFAGKGRTIFFKELIHETEKKSASRVRWLVWTFVLLLLGGVGGVYWYNERRVRETEVQLAAQRDELAAARASADSVRAAAVAEYQRLGSELESARAGSAPAAVVDSLRSALQEAQRRTSALEDALRRAQASVSQQLAAGDSLRQAAQEETARLRAQLANSSGGGNLPRALLDSLRQAVGAAEQRAAEIEAGLRAVRGADLASIAQANQASVGLVTTFAGADIYDGSGFAITADGYFITNRHVVSPGNQSADSVFVTFADQRTMSRADVIAVQPAPGADVAVLKIRNYRGPHVTRVDWTGTKARQGEPAALIGFPAGVAAALDETRTVRTSMSAGIFSKVTPDLIQFDGFTVGGSSGSPVFNADGEVVAVHAAGLREAAGLAFTVPARLVLGLLPVEVRRAVTR